MNEQLAVQEIVAILDKRLEDYDHLIGLAEEQKALLLANRRDDLQENLSKFDPVLSELQQLKTREDSVAKRIKQAQAAGDLPDFDIQSVYAELRDSILERVNRLRRLTEQNTRLIKNMMNLTRFTMMAISKMVARNSAKETRNPALLLDLRV
jgi:flagellar biosynthesis/type III secretory pathway chaperone